MPTRIQPVGGGDDEPRGDERGGDDGEGSLFADDEFAEHMSERA